MRFKTMENVKTVLSTLLVALMIGAIPMFSQAQDRNDIQYYVPPTQDGLNEFEAPFTTDKEFDGVEVRLGGLFQERHALAEAVFLLAVDEGDSFFHAFRLFHNCTIILQP